MRNQPELTFDTIKRMEDMTWFTHAQKPMNERKRVKNNVEESTAIHRYFGGRDCLLSSPRRSTPVVRPVYRGVPTGKFYGAWCAGGSTTKLMSLSVTNG